MCFSSTGRRVGQQWQSFSFLFPSFSLHFTIKGTGKKNKKKTDLETEQIAQWSSLLASCLARLMFMPMWERPDRVCPNPQAVLSSSGTQAMCFRGKPHKRELAGGRMFQKKPGHCKPRHQLETQLDVVNKSNYGNGGGNLRVNWKRNRKGKPYLFHNMLFWAVPQNGVCIEGMEMLCWNVMN